MHQNIKVHYNFYYTTKLIKRGISIRWVKKEKTG